MNNIKTFDEYISEMIIVGKNVKKGRYNIDKMTDSEQEMSRQGVDTIANSGKKAHMKKTTGEVDDLVKNIEYEKEIELIDNQNKMLLSKEIEQCNELGSNMIIEVPEQFRKSYIFDQISKNPAVGKGEHLLALMYDDVYRHFRNEKGDNITINNKEIEVKSAGATFSLQVDDIEDDNKGSKSMKELAALSLAKYLVCRDLDYDTKNVNDTDKTKKTLYLVFFDNTIKKDKIKEPEEEEITNPNTLKTGKCQVESEEAGSTTFSKFLLVNCGYTYNSRSKDTKNHIGALAEKLEGLISDKIEVKKTKPTTKTTNIMTCWFDGQQIRCIMKVPQK